MKKSKATNLRQMIKGKQVQFGYTNEEMGLKLRCSERTWYRKLAKVEDMKLRDLLRLEKIFHTQFLVGEET